MASRRSVFAAALVALVSGCAAPSGGNGPVPSQTDHGSVRAAPPERFTIVPDDYHVPFAGTTADGHKFFLSDELFDFDKKRQEAVGYVGLFLWNADGTFSEVRVQRISKSKEAPPGQAMSGSADTVVKTMLAELGDYKLEPIKVEPFMQKVDGVDFGWKVGRYPNGGEYYVSIVPGDFIVYYDPWDGLEYDT